MRFSGQFFLIWSVFGTLFHGTQAQNSSDFNLIDFLKNAQRFHGFEYVLFIHNQSARMTPALFGDSKAEDSFFNDASRLVHALMHQLEMPVLLKDEHDSFYLKGRFSENFLTLVRVEGSLNESAELLRNLERNLRHITTRRVLFLLNRYAHAQGQPRGLESLFRLCWNMKLINVAALLENFQTSRTFYGYNPFPKFELDSRTIARDAAPQQMFFSRLSNLKGHEFPYALGGPAPRVIVSQKPNGEMVVNGFVGHFMRAFAKKYNVRLVQPEPAKVGQFAPGRDLEELVRNGTVEMSVAMTFTKAPFVGYSYPYELIDGCLVLPMEAEVPRYKFFLITFKASTLCVTLLTVVLMSTVLSGALYQAGHQPTSLLGVLVHDDCLRGVLGQAFTEIARPPLVVRFIYLQICVLGIVLTTSYNSYFAAWITSAPREMPPRSFHDILAAGQKIFIWSPEYDDWVSNTSLEEYGDMFHKEPDYQTYLKVRDAFHSTYGYILPTTKRLIFRERLRRYSHPLFRVREDLCVFKNLPMSFPVAENSIYWEMVYQLILETAESGLTVHWKQLGLSELISARKLNFTRLAKKKQYAPMRVEDMQYIWVGLGTMVMVVLSVFGIELYVFYRALIHRVLRSWCRDCGQHLTGAFKRRNSEE